MRRLGSFLKSSMLRWWFMITAILTVSSTCPCCGKPACPAGLGGAVVLGGIASFVMKISQLFFRQRIKEDSLSKKI